MPDAEVEATAEVEDQTPLVLRTWGLSGQPASWAHYEWVTLIELIRLANRGVFDVAAVQAVLDETFPGAGYSAADIVLAHPPTGAFSITATDEHSVHVGLTGDADLALPDENVQWDFGDGTVVFNADGADHTYTAPGEYVVSGSVLVAGAAYYTRDSAHSAAFPETEPPDEYDPADHTVDEVLAYAAAHPEQVEAILEAEEAGKNRVGIVEKLA